MTFARISEIIHEHLGWCPNTPALRTSPAVLVVPPETINPSQPDGADGGSGRIFRGINLTLGSTKTLVRNKQLLWFSLMTGIVMTFLFITQYGLHLMEVYLYPAIDFPRWLILTFAAELTTVFCVMVLLAGLVLSLSAKEGDPVSFRKGLNRTKKYLRPLADWSVVLALVGTLLLIAVRILEILPINMLLHSAFAQFPFGFILLPEYFSIGPIGGTFAIEYGLTYTLILSAINVLLFVLTLFVVPLLVLENKRLPEAVAESVSLIKKVWVEMIICVLILGLILCMVSMMSFLFRVVYGYVAPDMLLFWYPGDLWIAAAMLFMLALCSLAFVISTIAGITVMNLYRYGKTGRIPAAGVSGKLPAE